MCFGCGKSEDGLTRLRLVPTCYFEPEQNALIGGGVNNATRTKLFEFEVQLLRLQITVPNRQHAVFGVIHHQSVPVPAYAHRPKHRSEHHTSELQSHFNLICPLLLPQITT